MQSALVLGSSGHIGNAVLRELLAQGWAVTAARRGRTAAHNLAGLPVRETLGDGNDPATLDCWVGGHDLVVDAAAPYPLSLGDVGAVELSARRAAILADAVTRHRARLVHIGSFVTQLGSRENGRRRERSFEHPYFAAKRAGEDVLGTAAAQGAPVTMVYPTYCLGPWDSRPTEMCLVPRLLAGEVPAVPAHIINVIDVRDVARGVVAAAREPRREPVLLVGHNVGLPELCALIGELAGVRVTPRSVPPNAARAGAWALELGVSGDVMPGVLLWTALLMCHSPFTVDATQRALGAVPRPLTTTLRDTIAWYRERPRDGAPAMQAPQRVRRPELARTGPRRHFAGMLGLANSMSAAASPSSGRAGPATRPLGPGTNGDAARGAGERLAMQPFAPPGDEDPVSQALRAGYDVIEQALRRRGLGELRSPMSSLEWAAPWASGFAGGMSGGPQSVGRWVDTLVTTLSQSALGQAAWRGATSPAGAARAEGPELDPLDVIVDMRTPRAAAVQLRLQPGAGPDLRVDRLIASAGPPITEVTVTLASGSARVALGALDQHPAGTYHGTVVSADRACGVLTVRLA